MSQKRGAGGGFGRYGPVRLLLPCLLLIAAAPEPGPTPPVAKAPTDKVGKVSAAFFTGLQELPPFTPEQMAARHDGAPGDPEAIAADQSLNDWKVCALDSITHWADLKAGRGEIVEGAMGRCADIARDYRNHLTRISQDGRFVLDLSFARQMVKSLEEQWRPRILAAAMDHDLEVVRLEKEHPATGRKKEPKPTVAAPAAIDAPLPTAPKG